MADLDFVQLDLVAESQEEYGDGESQDQLILRLESEMKAAAKELAFERAAELRNRIRSLRLKHIDVRS
jgi:excinuclease ABC subunit B